MEYAAEIGLAAARTQLMIPQPVVFGWKADRVVLSVLQGPRALQSLMTSVMLARMIGCQGVAFGHVGPVANSPDIAPSQDPSAQECAIGQGYDGTGAIWMIPLFRDDSGRVTNDFPQLAAESISPAMEVIELAWSNPFADAEVNSLWLAQNGCEVLRT